MKNRILFIFLAAVLLIAAPLFAQNSKYRLQPTDVLSITVHGQPDLATKTRVAAEGFISFPLLGKVYAKGLTVQELEEEIKNGLEKSYLVDAQVLVFIEEYHPKQVSVIGEVNKPGKYDMPEERAMTFLEAIAMAGGFTKNADIRGVKIMRTENGEQKTLKVNARDITVKEQKDKDILIEPEDIIVVPESFF